MQELLAAYIEELARAQASTHTAADRTPYRELLADAALLLARAAAGSTRDELLPLLRGHERLRGHTWLQGPERAAADAAWAAVATHESRVRAT